LSRGFDGNGRKSVQPSLDVRVGVGRGPRWRVTDRVSWHGDGSVLSSCDPVCLAARGWLILGWPPRVATSYFLVPPERPICSSISFGHFSLGEGAVVGTRAAYGRQCGNGCGVNMVYQQRMRLAFSARRRLPRHFQDPRRYYVVLLSRFSNGLSRGRSTKPDQPSSRRDILE
jgi:hypothetical protein